MAFLTACGGAGALTGGVAKGLVTILERVVSGSAVTYVLRQLNIDTGLITDLDRYPDLGFIGLLEGPSDTFFSLQQDGADAKLFQLATRGAVEVAKLPGGADLIISGPSGFLLVPNAEVAVGGQVEVRRLPYGSDASSPELSAAAPSALRLTSLAVDGASGALYFSAVGAPGDADGSVQLYQASGPSTFAALPVKFQGEVKGIAHGTIGSSNVLYALEQKDGDAALYRVNPAMPNEKLEMQVFAGAEAVGMTSSFSSGAVGFTLRSGGVSRAYRVNGIEVSEAASGAGVAGAVVE